MPTTELEGEGRTDAYMHDDSDNMTWTQDKPATKFVRFEWSMKEIFAEWLKTHLHDNPEFAGYELVAGIYSIYERQDVVIFRGAMEAQNEESN